MITSVEISGATGFIGQNVMDYLKNDFKLSSIKLRYVINQKIMIHSDAIIHLSGKAHDVKNTSTPKEFYEANFELTKQLFDAFLLSEARTFIYMSSVKAVADEVQGILSETAIPEPKTHYGKSKLMAEQYIFSKPIPNYKRVYVLRPCMVHGRGNKGNLNLLFNFVKKSIPYPLGIYDNNRSLLGIGNLCFIIKELIIQQDIASGVYNIADDLPLSTNQIIKMMSIVLSKKAKILKIDKKIIQFFAKLGDIFNLPINTERLKKLTENYVVDNSKIKLAIGKQLPLTSEDGLLLTLQSFKNG